MTRLAIVALIGVMGVNLIATPVSSATVDGIVLDTAVATNSIVTLGQYQYSFPLEYSTSIWNEANPTTGTAAISVNDEGTFETEASEGTFLWEPVKAGGYTLCHTVGGVSYRKSVNINAPTVSFTREGYSSCKLTPSDGVSPIRYTTDGSDPTASSTLYTGPFEISPLQWTTVKACTFGEGYLPGEVREAIFGKAGSTVCVARASCAMDNSTGVKSVGYEQLALPYDVTWEGDASSKVILSEDGTAFAERNGAGTVDWMPSKEGETTLSLKTLSSTGKLIEEYTADFYVYPMVPEEYAATSEFKFGRVYCGGWWDEPINFMEYELWDNNDAGLYGDEYAFFPVYGEGEIKPLIYGNVPATYLGTPQIWSDQEMFDKFTPKNVDPVNWWNDDDWAWEYETDEALHSWPQSVWPEKRVISERRWIVVPLNEVDVWSDQWILRVGIAGTSEISGPVLVCPGDGFAGNLDYTDFAHGITVDGVEYFDPCDDLYDGMETVSFENYASYFDNNEVMTFTVNVPSAGTLVIVGEEDNDNPAQQEMFSVSSNNGAIISDTEEVEYFAYEDPLYTRRIKVTKGSTLTFQMTSRDDCEAEFAYMAFYPEEKNSVFVSVGYGTEREVVDDVNRYWGCDLIRGYVTGGGVYTEGETVTLQAVAGEGEVFSHWVSEDIILTDEQAKSHTLSFEVTSDMCGAMEDEGKIKIKAVWMPKYRLTVLPSIVGAGKVTGSGRYLEGEVVTLTAQAAQGCTFVKWSDGVTSETRTFTIESSDTEQLVYAYFSAPDGVPDPLYWSIVFVGNGGEVRETERLVKKGMAVGGLPVPIMDGYEFVGWFTDNAGGEEIVAESVISRDLTLYARWKEIPRSPAELFGGEWTCGAQGSAEAAGYKDQTVDGGVSVKFTANHASESWIETEVTNGCRVTFSWKADCEDLFKGSPYDYLAFEVDGVRQGYVCGDKDWEEKSFVVSGKGIHHLRWTFLRDDETDGGNNCAYLANVEITRIYTIEFAVGEATGGEAPGVIEHYEGESIELPNCGSLVRYKHTFAGWSDGEFVYQPGESYSKNDDSVLMPVWTRNLLPKPVITAPEMFESDTCTVKISAIDGAEVRYTLDGTNPTSGSLLYDGSFEITETVTIKAIAVKDNHPDSAIAEFTVTRGVWTFGEYLNAPDYTFTGIGDALWERAKGVSEDGYALRSGEIAHSQKSGIEMTVNGAGTISFACRVEGEVAKTIVWDGLGFYIDGVRQGNLFGNDTWETKSFSVKGVGSHTLSWVYEKDEEGNGDGADCAWLDEVVWIPAAVVDPIPEVAKDSEVAAALGGSADAKLASNIKTAAEYTKYRTWALGLSDVTAEEVKASPNAWLSYALGCDSLIATAPVEGDVVIDTFESSSTDGAFEFTVKLKDIAVGDGALEDNLKKVFDIQGCETLSLGEFSSNAVQINAAGADNGNVKFTVSPKEIGGLGTSRPTSFFFKVKMK